MISFIRNANGTIKSYRQGDVHIVAIQSLPADAKQVERKGDIILAHGEVTGHAHRIKSKKAIAWEAAAERFIQAAEKTPITHEEHVEIPTDQGSYLVVIQTEYTPAELRRVAD